MKNFVEKNRVGRFRISNELLRTSPYKVKLIMSKVVVVRCDSLFYMNALEYVAYSPLFDIIEEGYVPQDYEFSIDGKKVITSKI